MRFANACMLIATVGLLAGIPSLGRAQTTPTQYDTLNGKVRAMPNPWSASKESQQFAGGVRNSIVDCESGHSRIAFINVPAVCTIRIYTIDGDLIATLPNPPPNAPAGTRANFVRWCQITDSDQYAVSGIYIWVVATPDGQSEFGKLIIIR